MRQRIINFLDYLDTLGWVEKNNYLEFKILDNCIPNYPKKKKKKNIGYSHFLKEI